jgi:polyisoprenoid-binding protein YceI
MKTTYQIDPAHSSAHFLVRHMMVANVRGAFSKVSGTVVYDPDNPGDTSIEAVIDASSIATREEARDTHLKSADFLHVEKHPVITFKSKKVEPAGDGELKVIGDLTIHGVTKEVVLRVEGPTPEHKDPWGNVKMGASATTKIKRSDFGLTWNAVLETGGILVGDDVKIEIDVELTKAQSTAA